MNISFLGITIFIIGIISLVGFFITKRRGFGRFATSTLLLLMVTIIAGLLFADGRIEAPAILNFLFAIVGFAGGLFAQKGEDACKTSGEFTSEKDTPKI